MFKKSVSLNPKLYFWANLFGSISLMGPVMSLFYLHRGLLFSDFFVLLILVVVTMFIFEVPTGIFADSKGPKTSMLIGQIISIISSILLLVSFNRWMFYFISILIGISITFFSGCDEAFIYDSLKERKKEKNFGKIWGKINSAPFLPAIITTILGSIIAKDLLEWQFILLISLGLFFSFVKLILLIYLKDPKIHFKRLNRINRYQHLRKGLKIIKKNPALLILFLSETLVLIPIHIFNNFNQPLLLENKVPVAYFGIIFALTSLLSYFALSKYAYLEKRFSKYYLIWLSGLATLLSYFLIAFFKGIFLVISILLIIKVCNVIRRPLFSQIKNDYIPSGSRATTLSLLSMIDSGFDILIFTIIGSIANLGLSIIFLGCSIVVLIGLLFPVRLKKK